MRIEGEPLTFLVILTIAAIHIYWQARLYRRMRELRFDDWTRLGSPSLTNVGIGRKFSYVRFVWLGGFVALEAPQISKACRVLRTIDVTTLMLALATLVVRQMS